MKIKYRLILLFLFLLFENGCSAQRIPDLPTPTAVLSEEPRMQEKEDLYTWDFGEVEEGDSVMHGFVLKNESANTLNILGINVSCGCITARAEKMALLSAEDTLVEVNFNSQGYSGRVEQYVFLNTDRPEDPVIRLAIKADVIK